MEDAAPVAAFIVSPPRSGSPFSRGELKLKLKLRTSGGKSPLRFGSRTSISPEATPKGNESKIPADASPNSVGGCGSGSVNTGGHNSRLSYRYTDRGSLLLQKSGVRIGRNGLRRGEEAVKTPESSTQSAASKLLGTPSNIPDNVVWLGSLGHGASGAVYKAIHATSLHFMAVKEVPVHVKAQRQQIGAEIKTLACGMNAPKSPHVVTFYDAFTNQDGDCVSIAMEHCAGGSLQDLMAAVGPLDEITLASVAQDAFQGLKDIHDRGLLHRDIKPSNMLLDGNGVVKLADFGLVREAHTDIGAQIGEDGCQSPPVIHSFVGTAVYMSPERLQGVHYSYSSDVWSLGLSLLTLALGRFPMNVPRSNLYWYLVKVLCSPSTRTTPKSLQKDETALGKSYESPGARSEDVRVEEGELPEQYDLFLCPENVLGMSEILQDFFRCCLRRDPAKRGTVTELLEHPFLAVNLQANPSPNPNPKDKHTSSTNRYRDEQRWEELRDICQKVCAFHLEPASQEQNTSSTGDFRQIPRVTPESEKNSLKNSSFCRNKNGPPLDAHACRRLSLQLGLPVALVEGGMQAEWEKAVLEERARVLEESSRVLEESSSRSSEERLSG